MVALWAEGSMGRFQTKPLQGREKSILDFPLISPGYLLGLKCCEVDVYCIINNATQVKSIFKADLTLT